MGRKLLLLNLVILTGIIVVAQALVQSWQEFQGVPAVAPSASRAPDLGNPPRELPPASLPQFLVISEKNLFSKDRGEQPADDGADTETAPELPARPKLISVSSFGGAKEAVLEVFSGRRGQQSERKVVKLGDDVLGYTVSEIESDSLTLAWQDVREVIDLEAVRSQPRANRRASRSVNIITVGSAAAAVESTTPETEDEEARGLEVGVVSAQQGRAQGRRGQGAAAGGLRGGGARGQGGVGRSTGGRRNFGQNNQRNNQGLPGTVGFGQPRPPAQQRPPR